MANSPVVICGEKMKGVNFSDLKPKKEGNICETGLK